tara:strand:- start:880 stop:1137 length:258 start_codon:yes stop_codon:yes gene_type:complete
MSRLDKRQGSTHYENNETKKMYELQKTICLLVLSAPLLYGVNHLAHRVNTYDHPTIFTISSNATPEQAYGKGAYQDYQVRSYGRF